MKKTLRKNRSILER